MATINLGAIKFNWKGAYNSGTSYAVDDVVSSGGNSYVCIQAHSNQAVGNATAYWNIMSSAGTNGTDGTDVGTTLTTQGDILYRDGSGLQRLGAGTSGQLLTTSGTGANPSWTTVDSGGVIQTKFYQTGAVLSATNTSFADLGSFSLSITPTSASNKILLMASFGRATGMNDGANTVGFVFTRDGSQITRGDANGSRDRYGWSLLGTSYSSTNHTDALYFQSIDSPNTTSAITYKIQCRVEAGTFYLNRNGAYANISDVYGGIGHSSFIIQEIKA